MKVVVTKQNEFALDTPQDTEELDSVINALYKGADQVEKYKERMEKVTRIHFPIDAVVNDALWAVSQALQRKFKFVSQGNRNIAIQIATGVNKCALVPYGKFEVPGVDGHIELIVDGHTSLVVGGQVKEKHKHLVHEMVELAKDILRKESIYKGKAVKVDTFITGGLLEPEFMDTTQNGISSLILPSDLTAQVESSIFAPIQYTAALRRSGIPLKRGVLLAGPYGTGKTLTAYVTAHLCEKYGWTFVYVKNAKEMAQGLEFARRYQPAVLFHEDGDTALGGERDSRMNNILNVADGVDSKSSEVMLVLTTNHVEEINPAMLRPGRLDHVITFRAPDAAAAERILRQYGGSTLSPDINLGEAARAIAHAKLIPASIAEAIKRAKLSAIKLSLGKSDIITEDALLEAIAGVTMQSELHQLERRLDCSLGDQLGESVKGLLQEVVQERIHPNVLVMK